MYVNHTYILPPEDEIIILKQSAVPFQLARGLQTQRMVRKLGDLIQDQANQATRRVSGKTDPRIIPFTANRSQRSAAGG